MLKSNSDVRIKSFPFTLAELVGLEATRWVAPLRSDPREEAGGKWFNPRKYRRVVVGQFLLPLEQEEGGERCA